MTRLENIAHRGASLHAPENTLAAFDLAIHVAADRVELDVRLAADGTVVVTHDPSLVRTTDADDRFPGRTPWHVADFSWPELARLDLAWPTDDDRPPERLTTLAEALGHLRGRTTLMLELKDPDGQPGLVEAVAVELRGQDWWLDRDTSPRLILQSFDAGAVANIRRLLPDHVAGAWLVPEGVAPDLTELPAWATVLVVDHVVVTPDLVTEVHRRGRALHAYTVNDPGRLATLAEQGLDGIITDDPGTLAALTDGSDR